MVSFEEIMTTLEESHIATVVRNCSPTSVLEAKVAIRNHPSLEIEVIHAKSTGTCVAIRPKDFDSTADDVCPFVVKGHSAVSSLFGRKEKE